MAQNSAIEWTNRTWNFLKGCTWESSGCDNCYAAPMTYRLEAMAWADIEAGRDPGKKAHYIGLARKNNAGRIHFTGKVFIDREASSEPLYWKKPQRVFVNSMSDLFHPDVPFEIIDQAFAMMWACSHHTFQILTKRPARMLEWYRQSRVMGMPFPNVWLGVSVENQAAADERIPLLLQVPAAVRFLSCEPLLGPLNLSDWIWGNRCPSSQCGDSTWDHYCQLGEQRLHWIIVGGESGHNARPMHPDWARSLRDQCHAAGVAYFFKQWGEWLPFGQVQSNEQREACSKATMRGDQTYFGARVVAGPQGPMTGTTPGIRPVGIHRVGKHAAGRLLDGREWNQFPEAA